MKLFKTAIFSGESGATMLEEATILAIIITVVQVLALMGNSISGILNFAGGETLSTMLIADTYEPTLSKSAKGSETQQPLAGASGGPILDTPPDSSW